MPKIIDANIQLPILVERIDPNPIIVPKPTLISKTSSSIEVEQTFQCDVDYYGGVGIEQNGDVDAKLVKNPNTMTATLTGLSVDTEYTIKGVSLPILGNETISEGLVVRTKATPIPDEYQLVEYLENNGSQYIDLPYYPHTYTEVTTMFYPFRATGNDGVFGSIGWYEDRNNSYSIGTWMGKYVVDRGSQRFSTNASVVIGLWSKISLKPEGFYLNDSLVQPLNGEAFSSRNNLRIFSRTAVHLPGVMRISYFKVSDSSVNIDLYPVYRKSDSKPGMYDIVNHQFYTNSGPGEFLVGPNKEWEE